MSTYLPKIEDTLSIAEARGSPSPSLSESEVDDYGQDFFECIKLNLPQSVWLGLRNDPNLINARNKDRETPLMVAAQRGNEDIIQALIMAKAKL